jgi:hypothetical protein
VKQTVKTGFRILVLLTFSTFASALIAQETEKYVLDHVSPRFNDGIYTNIDMIRCNCPIPSTWIETDVEVNDRDFYKLVTRAEKIVFFDDNGVRSVLDTKSIWGYSYNGDLYINVGGAFHEIDLMGRFSHFIAARTTYDPFFYTDEIRPGTYYYRPPVVTLKHREYLVDIMDNKVWEFDSDGLERVLENDTLLLEEFNALNKREKEYLKYIYLNRYNEKYLLDIPF